MQHVRCRNAAEVRRRWQGRFGNIPAPTKRTITKTYQKFRPRAVRTPENIELVRESLTQHGNRSSRQNGLGLSRSSFHRIAKLDIKFHPYVMITRQKLREGDPIQ